MVQIQVEAELFISRPSRGKDYYYNCLPREVSNFDSDFTNYFQQASKGVIFLGTSVAVYIFLH